LAGRLIVSGIVRDITIILIGILLVWIGLQLAFGIPNPFYVVASGSMIPELQVYDILVVQGNAPFDDLRIGDIIVFDRPSDHDRVIVHRVVSVMDDDPRTLRTKGDANRASIPGTDFPITEKEYIGKVEFVIPQAGYVTQVLQPPVNFIIIAIVIGAMVAKQFMGKRKKDDNVVLPVGTVEKSGSSGDGDGDSDGDGGNNGNWPIKPTAKYLDMPDLDNAPDDSEYMMGKSDGNSTMKDTAEDVKGDDDGGAVDDDYDKDNNKDNKDNNK